MKTKFIFCAFFFLATLYFSAQVHSDDPLPPSPPDESGTKSEDYIYTVPEEIAEYPGGSVAMTDYIKKNLHYPPAAREAGLTGVAFVKFIIDKEGNIKDVSVLKGVPSCKECDDEAIKMIKGMPSWKPGKVKGKAVNSWFNLPVKFRP